MFSPPSLRGVIAVPGNIGGANWSGFSFDPGRHRLVVNTTNLPYVVKLIPRDQLAAAGKPDPHAEFGRQDGAPYVMSRTPLLGPSGAPCVKPPWGELIAVDLDTGSIPWRRPLGSMRELAPGADDSLGSIMLGGSITTAGGLIFVGGALDRTFRALDIDTGRQVWSADLPASAHATPMTFSAKGRQYVVVAAGGAAKITEERQGDEILAYALP